MDSKRKTGPRHKSPPHNSLSPAAVGRTGISKLKRWPIPLVLIGLFAFVLRLIYLLELRNTSLFSVIIGDAKEYDLWAQRIAGGQWIGSEVFYQTPLYPYLLAIIFKLAGHQLIVARLAQVTLGSISCVLLGYAGRRFFNQQVGIVAAFLLAIYAPAIFFDGLIQKSSLDLFLITVVLAAIGEFLEKRSWKWLVPAGITLGAFMINRENARILYPIVIIWILAYFRAERLGKRLSWAAIFTLSAAALLTPIGLRNYYVGGEFLISTSQLGPNLYIGNHAGARGSYEPLIANHGNAEFERSDAKQLAEKAAGRNLSPSEVSDYWVNRSFEYIRNHPLDWLRLFGRKLLLTFNAREAVDTESIEAYSQNSIVLRVLFWMNFGFIFSLAAAGVWLTRERWRHLAILYAMVLGMALSVAIFYVVARYRYPLVPFMLLLAAAAISVVPSIRTLSLKRLLTALLIAGAAGIVTSLPIKGLGDETFLNIGEELIRMNRPGEAIPILKQAVAASPDSAQTHYNLGLALKQAGAKEAALNEFAEAIRLRTNYFEAHAARALTLEETGKSANAVDEFREALRLQPNNAATHVALADLLVAMGRTSEGTIEYQQAANIAPDLFEARYRLAQAFVRNGRLTEAVDSLEKALAIANAQGRTEEARQIQNSIKACRDQLKQGAGEKR
jgi:tetratricopeptide (TPR) repeat protein